MKKGLNMQRLKHFCWIGVCALAVLSANLLLADQGARHRQQATQFPRVDQTINAKDSDRRIKEAFQNAKSNFWVQSQGEVIKLMKDDNDGARHQRFLLRLANGHTLLVAHNIDIAPRINALKLGDQVAFYGEYEWNHKGGVIHWTHRDPSGRKAGGWLRHRSVQYD